MSDTRAGAYRRRDAAARGVAPETSTSTISALVVASVRLYRDWLRNSLDLEPDICVVQTLSSPDSLPCEATRLQPDVVVSELSDLGHLDVLRQAHDACPEMRVVGLVRGPWDCDVVAYSRVGVAGYVTSDQSLPDLVDTVRAVSRGETVCSPRMGGVLIERLAALSAPGDGVASLSRLTAREREIAELIARGDSNRDIARELCIELATVKNHVHNVLFKLQLRRRGEVAAAVHGRTAAR